MAACALRSAEGFFRTCFNIARVWHYGRISRDGIETFKKWKREKIEERRIETAIDALALAYESKIVFRSIRSSMSSEVDYEKMPIIEGELSAQRSARGSYWVVGRRVYDNKGYFDRVWKLQPVVMAIFGEDIEIVFGKLHEARAMVQVASNVDLGCALSNTEDNRVLHRQLRTDLWGGDSDDVDRVQLCSDEFRGDRARM